MNNKMKSFKEKKTSILYLLLREDALEYLII